MGSLTPKTSTRGTREWNGVGVVNLKRRRQHDAWGLEGVFCPPGLIMRSCRHVCSMSRIAARECSSPGPLGSSPSSHVTQTPRQGPECYLILLVIPNQTQRRNWQENAVSKSWINEAFRVLRVPVPRRMEIMRFMSKASMRIKPNTGVGE